MKVILQETVRNLGMTGEVVDVADGYARNFLIPRGLAVEATRAALRTLENERKALEKQRAREEASARDIAARMEGLALEIPVKAGEAGRLYGSVTSSDIADAIQAVEQVDIDRRRVELSDPIKALGTYSVPVRVHPGVTATVQVQVVAAEEEDKEPRAGRKAAAEPEAQETQAQEAQVEEPAEAAAAAPLDVGAAEDPDTAAAAGEETEAAEEERT